MRQSSDKCRTEDQTMTVIRSHDSPLMPPLFSIGQLSPHICEYVASSTMVAAGCRLGGGETYWSEANIMPEFFDLRPPVVLVEEDRTARKEDRRQFEDSLDRYLELKEKLDKKIVLGQNISWDEESEFISVSNEVLKSVIVIGCWQLGMGSEWVCVLPTAPRRRMAADRQQASSIESALDSKKAAEDDSQSPRQR